MTNKPKPIIALTGGVASGKSAVAQAFARRGAEVIDVPREVALQKIKRKGAKRRYDR